MKTDESQSKENSSVDHPLVWVESIVKSFIEVPLSNCESYEAIELQQLQVGDVSGCIAVLYLHDGKVDLLHEKQLPLSRQWANSDPAMAAMDVNVIRVFDYVDIERFEIGKEVARLNGEFKDNAGQLVRIEILANLNCNPKPLFTPAPRVTSQKENAGLRFLHLDFFTLLPISSKINITIDGVKQQATAFLLPALLARYSSTRIGTNLLLASLHKCGATPSAALGGDHQFSDLLRITSAANRIGVDKRWFEISHMPPLESLEEFNSIGNGQMVVRSELGIVASGKYSLKREDSAVSDGNQYRVFDVSQNWFPGIWPLPRLCLFILRRLRRFSSTWSSS